MKKQLSVSWKTIPDATGYLHSFAKSLACALWHSPYQDLADTIVAASGFAFRMWAAKDLCPSAASVWSFEKQKDWAENAGLVCAYAGRCWGEEAFEQERRLLAIDLIKTSIDGGVPAICWEVGLPEWGVITGYDDDAKTLLALPVNQSELISIPYSALGNGEVPILSVLTVTGRREKSEKDVLRDTMRLAIDHLTGKEWSDENASGLAAYETLLCAFAESPESLTDWNAEYMLGTYAALKEHAHLFFARAGEQELAALYQAVFDGWMDAYRLRNTDGKAAVQRLKDACESEKRALFAMQSRLEENT